MFGYIVTFVKVAQCELLSLCMEIWRAGQRAGAQKATEM